MEEQIRTEKLAPQTKISTQYSTQNNSNSDSGERTLSIAAGPSKPVINVWQGYLATARSLS